MNLSVTFLNLRMVKMKHYDEIIKLRKGKLYIHESGESEPLGVIIDYYDNDLDELIDTFTIWYEDNDRN